MREPALAAADLLACQTLLDTGSRSFYAASLLLPARVARPATALYAFCRVADDLIDRASPAALPAIQAGLGERLDAIYAFRPHDHAEDRALGWVVQTHRLPRLLFDRLLEGFAWDAAGRRYPDLDALLDYAARVAGTVGACMALLMGVRDPAALARACDLGIAMQLTNIARDVGEDARAGRVYLPLGWMAAAGVAPEAFLADPRPSPALAGVIARLLDVADGFYRSADAGIAVLPRRCRPGIAAARLLYAAIGTEVRRNGHDSVTARARVPARRKLGLLARAPASLWPRPAAIAAVPMACTRDLVAAGACVPARRVPAFGARLAWAATLLADLDARQWRQL